MGLNTEEYQQAKNYLSAARSERAKAVKLRRQLQNRAYELIDERIIQLNEELDQITDRFDRQQEVMNGLICWYKMIEYELDQYQKKAFLEVIKGVHLPDDIKN